MKSALAFLLVTACASSPKPVDRAIRPDVRTVSAEIDGRRVAFEVGGVWVPLPPSESGAIVLRHADDRTAAIGIYFDRADPGSTVEEATARWMAIMLSAPTVYAIKEVSKPVFASEEDASFTFFGWGDKRPMTSKCRVKLVSSRVIDYWTVIFSVTPADGPVRASPEVDRIAESLRIETPK